MLYFRIFLGSVFWWLWIFPLLGQGDICRKAAFYNVENLFDTVNDPASQDGDFTPDGRYGWTEERLNEKTGHLARVLSEIAADLVGLAEVENAPVVERLAGHPAVAALGYGFVHFDSPDPRGIDVALLYRRARFRPLAMQAVRYRQLPHYRTREMLHVRGVWQGHPTHVLVCHLPSVLSSRQVRHRAAASVRFYADSLLRADPDHLLVLMGDFNANPGSRPMKLIGQAAGLDNPFAALYKSGYGTYLYRGKWNMYDSVLVGGTLPGRVQAQVFIRDYLIQPDGPYQGYPYRSFSGFRYISGYSDHLPVVLTFAE
ncbi:MAG: endonuclease/exonuclease/phosphatase family protein [Rikenellaceae bacterium]|nr:endonuclease/exonuclease/phosphatase family protein [Rikenellaceae bacterium]